MKDHDVPMSHKARPIVAADFEKFDFIFGMDKDNIRYIMIFIFFLYFWIGEWYYQINIFNIKHKEFLLKTAINIYIYIYEVLFCE